MVQQLRELRDQHGYDVTAIIAEGEGNLRQRLREANIPFHETTFRGGSGSPRAFLDLPYSIWKLARLLRRERFDIVQSHVFFTMLVARPAAWLADVPIRLAMLASPYHLEAYTSRWIDQATWWMETFIIPSCEFSVRLCREIGVPQNRLALIYYSADENDFDPESVAPANIRDQYGWPADTLIISQVAYFYPRLPRCRWVPEATAGLGGKGHEDLVNAAPIVLSEFPNAKFLLVGSGWGEAGESYLQEIKDLVSRKGLQESVVFSGYRPDANAVLRDSNVTVQASLSENLGGTIEGLLMECPMVVTRVGGMPDAVRDNKTGLLVNPRDPQDLARGILQQLRHPEAARTMAKAGRQWMLERFTLTRTASDLAELYGRLLANRKRRWFYNPAVSAGRLLLGLPIFAYMAFRLIVVDIFLHAYGVISSEREPFLRG